MQNWSLSGAATGVAHRPQKYQQPKRVLTRAVHKNRRETADPGGCSMHPASGNILPVRRTLPRHKQTMAQRGNSGQPQKSTTDPKNSQWQRLHICDSSGTEKTSKPTSWKPCQVRKKVTRTFVAPCSHLPSRKSEVFASRPNSKTKSRGNSQPKQRKHGTKPQNCTTRTNTHSISSAEKKQR